MLLAASYFFYATASPSHALVLLLVTTLTYFSAFAVERRSRRSLVAVAIIAIALPLVFYKYLAFSLEVAAGIGLVQASGWSGLNVLLPVGISFYTFQAISYVIDVYRRVTRPESSYITLSLYLAFFPQVLAGPIERAKKLIPQLAHLRPPHAANIYIGLKIALWGYFCKLIIADPLGGSIGHVIREYDSMSRFSLLSALYLFSLRIYFDFYGYTSIAIGVARMFGVNLSQNFNNPYVAATIRDFWRRWHITLMTWLRDYVYIPLGGRDQRYLRYALTITAVFLFSGLWHGAAVGFLIWGLMHAGLFLVGVASASVRNTVYRSLGLLRLGRAFHAGRVLTAFTLVSIAWLPFIVPTSSSIVDMYLYLFGLDRLPLPHPLISDVLLQRETLAAVVFAAVALLVSSLGFVQRVTETVPRSKREIAMELAMVNPMIVLIALLGDLGPREFIYFRF